MMIRSGRIRRAVLDQVGGRDRTFAFDVRRSRFQSNDVILLQLQFGRVFDRDDTVFVGDEADSVFSSVVLPEPVPPEMIMFSRALMQPSSNITISGVKAL